MAVRNMCVGLAAAALLLAVSCTDTITVRAHADVTDLEFEDEHVGTLNAGQEAEVDVRGRTLVTWKYEGYSESDRLSNPEDGKVWHLYASYGSWDEW